MESKELEFRGIPIDHLGSYFEELGAHKCTNTFPYVYEKANWKAAILNETIISFTANFKVNAVKILFSADNQDTLAQLIKDYRFKTTRVGG